ncbi:MAG: hypothetical protein ABIO65_04910, partial [Nitrospiria bacterium]
MPALPTVISVLAIPSLLLFPRTRVSICVPRAFSLRLSAEGIEEGGVLGIVTRGNRLPSVGAILPLGCAANVCHVQPLPCGRATHMHLHGFRRFEIRREWIEGDCGSAEILEIAELPG